MNIDLASIPVIDNHCHPFPQGREPAHYERNFCIGFYDVPPVDMRNTLYFNQVINALRRYYGLPETATVDEVIAKRNELALGDRKAYAQKLFKDANIVGFLCDFGFPISRKHHPELALTQAEIDEYYDCCGDVAIGSIDRIEWVANRLLDEHLPFDVFEERLVKETKEMVEKRNLISIKSVIAYYTGLDVRPLSPAEFSARATTCTSPTGAAGRTRRWSGTSPSSRPARSAGTWTSRSRCTPAWATPPTATSSGSTRAS